MRKLHLNDFKDGWILGNFKPSIFKREGFEIGIIKHYQYENRPAHRHNFCTEINVLLEGRMQINGKEIRPNDIFVFEKGETAEKPYFHTDVKILCIKLPSVPGDKEII